MAKTLYQLLGVAPNATTEAIKEAYVKNAARLRASGATGEAEVLKQAYDVLTDARLRARYDQQAYTVSGSAAPLAEDGDERHWLFTRRGAIASLGAVLIAFFAWSWHKREQERMRLEQERIEASRQAEEQRRYQEARAREDEQRAEAERNRIASESAAAQQANRTSRTETLYRDTLQHDRNMQNDRLRLARERDRMAREDAERRRQDLQNARDLARDKRQYQELEKTSPRRF